MKLSEIKLMDVKQLKPSPYNGKFFKVESRQYFDSLHDDIKKRGILVPLIAKPDGTLLAGHNRLTVAKSLKIKRVPVQYVQGKLTAQQEKEFIIKDNLLRRHLTYEERVALYRKIFKNFNERVMQPGKMGLKSMEIAAATGLNPQTINYDVSRIKHLERKKQIEASEIDIPNERAVYSFKKACMKMLNLAIIEKPETVKAFAEIASMADTRLAAILKAHGAKDEYPLGDLVYTKPHVLIKKKAEGI
jgi:hypothetical protein